MVNIDTIYQRVLAAANKEQRGYITPQEFNLFANQAQMDIFEQYFYDMNQFERTPENTTEYSNMVDLIDEKISMFKEKETPILSLNGEEFVIPTSVYRLGIVTYNQKHVVEYMQEDEVMVISKSRLSTPSKTKPVYTRYKNSNSVDIIKVYPSSINSLITFNCIKKPKDVYWGYAVIGGKALYNASASINFDLHPSEEKKLVLKILTLAGIMLKDGNLYQVASTETQQAIQQEKS
tara:strand:+ start:167 stop:871 length:705 start_codon:yes stop_codon:yes gene_type:complete